jgi:hypothetical protein
MSLEQFVDFLFASSYWLVVAGFVLVAAYVVYSRLRGGE